MTIFLTVKVYIKFCVHNCVCVCACTPKTTWLFNSVRHKQHGSLMVVYVRHKKLGSLMVVYGHRIGEAMPESNDFRAKDGLLLDVLLPC